MTVKLNSYISFQDNAREAIEFYKSVFGGEVYMDTFGSMQDSGMPVDEGDKEKIMHAYLKGENGVEVMAADTPKGIEFQTGSRVSLTLNGDDEPLLRSYWEKLAAGGKVTVPLEKAPWGDTFGMLTDKFGVEWMIDIGPVQ
ncbi:TPA: VOC family protein [Candidatus Saccharibacteria bacterium]|nr:MAG: 3-demethylubiquinone-9 3-methyltransferase, PhnB protein [Candidatus Saccharibacteria bacterium GW2011_GWC2_44_17]OGL33733.1 MAG: hypothetical protein A3E20_03190 [Candidatus Saccharibacteria bacterium RIFCSPHIGHO2_12_FULL_47_16]HBH77901.1 VOC family protein [Candidatus Saccharibacteria bacterium]